MWKRSNLLAGAVALTVLVHVTEATKGSCEAARKCCDGKDANCASETAPFNHILPHGQDVEPCYCDHGCVHVGDCCPDFKEYCGVMDCRVGEWSDWSKCEGPCGSDGTASRHRQILHPESNGGKNCPNLKEEKTCRVPECSRRQLDKVSALRETAMLLPGKYARQNLRRVKEYEVRANLKSFKTEQEKDSPYCVVFQVNKATRNCLKHKETRELHRGNTVCVMCDTKAQRSHLGGRCTGHGTEGKRTRFKDVMRSRCHGKWTRIDLVDGKCPCRNGPDLIFV